MFSLTDVAGPAFFGNARYMEHCSSAMHLSSSDVRVSSSGPDMSAMPVLSAMPSGMQMSSAVLGSPVAFC